MSKSIWIPQQSFRSISAPVICSIIMSHCEKGNSADQAYFDFRKEFHSAFYSNFGASVSLVLCGAGLGTTWPIVSTTVCCINGCSSSLLPVTLGVPQGSIFGPLLFLVFINDFPSGINHSHMYLFADDSKLQQVSSSSYHLQEDINSLAAWSEDNLSS